MSRTQKDVVDYFPHVTRAATGDTLTILQSKWGNDGYAFWFKVLEKLGHTDGHYIDLRNPVKRQLFLAYLRMDEQTTVEIIDLLVEMGNYDKDLWNIGVIWCDNFIKEVAGVYQNRKRNLPSKPILNGSNLITTVEIGITTDNLTSNRVTNSDSRVEYSIVDDSRVDENIGDAPPEWYFILDKFKKFEVSSEWLDEIEDKYSYLGLAEVAREFVDYWSERRKEIRSMKASFRNRLKYMSSKPATGPNKYTSGKFGHLVQQ